MSIGLAINFKDDIELLIKNIRYHQSIGIECMLLSDRGATPKDRARLNSFCAGQPIKILTQNTALMSKNSREFIYRREHLFNSFRNQFPSEWLAIIDTDEFIISKTDSILDDPACSKANLVTLPRYNFALSTDRFFLSDTAITPDVLKQKEVIHKPIPLTREYMDQNPDTPWVMASIVPKFMTRIKTPTSVAPGFHSLQSANDVVEDVAVSTIIAHAPFSGIAQFKRKVSSIKEQLANIGDTYQGRQAWHWKRLAELQSESDVVDEYRKQFFTKQELENMRSDNTIKRVEGILN